MAGEKSVEQLQAELVSANKAAEAAMKETEVANKALDLEKVAHEKTKTSSLKQVKQLQDKLQKTINASAGKFLPSVEIAGVEYQARFKSMKMEDGVVMTAEEIFADTELCKKLISEGSGMFKNIKAEEAKRNKAKERARASRPRQLSSDDED